MEDTHKYEKLKELLEQNKKWPMLYMFKFIVKNQNDRVKTVAGMLPQDGAVTYKHTKNLKHVSITCKVMMESAEHIIELTSKIEKLEGVFSL